MPTRDPQSGPPPGAHLGFQTYADDTPREVEPLAMGRIDDRPTRRARWPAVVAGVAVLAAFGGGYLVARTSDAPSSPARPTSETAAMAAAAPMNVEVAQVAPIPVAPLSATGKLDVLPPGSVSPPSLPPRRAPEPAFAAAPSAPPPTELAALPPRETAVAPSARDASAVERDPSSYDCADAPTLARQMVCRDGGLAAMDQRMKQAYAAAIASGAREDVLAADQADWLDVREEAAHRSRWSVANIYRQRIDELRAIAAGERP